MTDKLTKVREQLKTADTDKIIRLRGQLRQAIETGRDPSGNELDAQMIADSQDVLDLYLAELESRK